MIVCVFCSCFDFGFCPNLVVLVLLSVFCPKFVCFDSDSAILVLLVFSGFVIDFLGFLKFSSSYCLLVLDIHFMIFINVQPFFQL